MQTRSDIRSLGLGAPSTGLFPRTLTVGAPAAIDPSICNLKANWLDVNGSSRNGSILSGSLGSPFRVLQPCCERNPPHRERVYRAGATFGLDGN